MKHYKNFGHQKQEIDSAYQDRLIQNRILPKAVKYDESQQKRIRGMPKTKLS
jgi:hypothetical protein